MKIGPRKRRFCDFKSLPWQRSLRYGKVIYEDNKHFHTSTNPEILVTRPLVSEIPIIESRPLKIYKIKNKRWQNIYSTFGKFAERAKISLWLSAICVTRWSGWLQLSSDAVHFHVANQSHCRPLHLRNLIVAASFNRVAMRRRCSTSRNCFARFLSKIVRAQI